MKLLILLTFFFCTGCDINLNQEYTNCTSTIHCDDQSERFCDKITEQNTNNGECVDQICYLNYSEYCVETVICEKQEESLSKNK